MSPEEVIKVLSTFGSGSGFSLDYGYNPFTIEDGAIVILVWDMHELPYGPDIWRDDLSIRELVLWNWNESPDLGITTLVLPRLSQLVSLDCANLYTSALDLSPVPNLTELRCQTNYLTELDLSPVPNLTELMCGDNQLTEVNLSPVPNLTALYCYVYHDNKLTELDLSPVLKLGYLRCNEEVEILNPRSSMTVERDREWEDGEYDHYDDYSSGLW